MAGRLDALALLSLVVPIVGMAWALQSSRATETILEASMASLAGVQRDLEGAPRRWRYCEDCGERVYEGAVHRCAGLVVV